MIAQNVKKRSNFLLAFDGSEHARAAVSFLYDLIVQQGVKTKSSIVLLAVFTPRQIGDLTPLQQALEQTHIFYKQKGIRSKTELILGYPGEKIIEYANELKPALIAIGAKGLRAAFGIMLGGVAQNVVEHACCPVLVVRAPYKGFRRILLVADGSPHSQRAVEYLTHFRLSPITQLSMMHVLPPIPIKPVPDFITHTWPSSPEVMPPFSQELSSEELAMLREEEKGGQAILDQAVQLFQEKGSRVQIRQVLLRGDAASEIIQYAKDQEIDLIVSGARGESAIRSWLLGSVSRKLVHYANCSVLIVKEPGPSN